VISARISSSGKLPCRIRWRCLMFRRVSSCERSSRCTALAGAGASPGWGGRGAVTLSRTSSALLDPARRPPRSAAASAASRPLVGTRMRRTEGHASCPCGATTARTSLWQRWMTASAGPPATVDPVGRGRRWPSGRGGPRPPRYRPAAPGPG
jgi:hypothetical protein